MAIIRSGPMLGFSGTIDGHTYSRQPNGTTVVKKKNGPRTKPATPAQRANENDTRVFAAFMTPLTEYATIAFQQQAKELGINGYNAMVKCNRKNALTGTYPNRSIDFSKVLMSKGSLPASHAEVSVTASGLVFNWDTTLLPKATHHTDQVMLLAYFPALRQCRYITAGAQRYTGKDILHLSGIKKGHEAEVYLSFVTDDRKSISDSVYLGKVIW